MYITIDNTILIHCPLFFSVTTGIQQLKRLSSSYTGRVWCSAPPKSGIILYYKPLLYYTIHPFQLQHRLQISEGKGFLTVKHPLVLSQREWFYCLLDPPGKSPVFSQDASLHFCVKGWTAATSELARILGTNKLFLQQSTWWIPNSYFSSLVISR